MPRSSSSRRLPCVRGVGSPPSRRGSAIRHSMSPSTPSGRSPCGSPAIPASPSAIRTRPWARPSWHAARFAAGATGGPLADLLKVGGVSQAVLGLGFTGPLGGSRTFPVRGYRGNALLGRRAATTSVEYRVPLALVGESLGHLPFGADKLWLALFGDAGDAWNPGIAPRLGRLRSAGVELVADLTVSYDVPLEVRLGVAQPLATPPSGDARRPRVYLALAADF